MTGGHRSALTATGRALAAQDGRRRADDTTVTIATSRLLRVLGWTFVAGLTAAAVAASLAVLRGGPLSDGNWQVPTASLGFAIFGALGASGVSLQVRGGRGNALLGGLTVLLAAVGYALLLRAIWVESDLDLWKAWACVLLASLTASHASLVLAARRPGDAAVITVLVAISIALGVVDALAGVLPLAGVVDEWSLEAIKRLAVLVIALVLTTSLPPIVRRLTRL